MKDINGKFAEHICRQWPKDCDIHRPVRIREYVLGDGGRYIRLWTTLNEEFNIGLTETKDIKYIHTDLGECWESREWKEAQRIIDLCNQIWPKKCIFKPPTTQHLNKVEDDYYASNITLHYHTKVIFYIFREHEGITEITKQTPISKTIWTPFNCVVCDSYDVKYERKLCQKCINIILDKAIADV